MTTTINNWSKALGIHRDLQKVNGEHLFAATVILKNHSPITRKWKYDYDLARFTCPDPLWEKYYSWTPYQYCMDNPVDGHDGNGFLKIPAQGEKGPFNKQAAPNYHSAYPAFVKIVNQLDKYLVDNKNVLKSMSETSKKSEKRILSDFKSGQGPKVFTEDMSYFGWSYGKGQPFSVRSAEVIYAQEDAKAGNDQQANTEATITVLSIIHEYLHYLGVSEDNIASFEKKFYGLDKKDLGSKDKIVNQIDNGTIPKIDITGSKTNAK
jgi:hypothetical protein